MRLLTASLVGLVVTFSTARAGDWPQFQGPERNGVSQDKGLADTWPANGPKLLWSNDKLGQGYGGAVVQGGMVYVMDRVDNKQDILRCLSLESGKELWQFANDAPGAFKGGYNGSRNVPAVDDKNVYAIGVYGLLTCVSKETHQPLWSVDLVKEYGATVSNWGFCQSPALYKDWVIVLPLSKQAGVLALDRATGKVAWKSERVGEMAWTSPLVATIGGVDQIVILTSRGEPIMTGLDAATGKVLWRYKSWICPNPIASPILLPDDRIFVTGGYDAGSALVQIKKNGETWTVTEVFRNKVLSSQAQNPVFYKGYIYGNSAGNKQGLMCIDPAGELKWKTGKSASEEDTGNILIADDKLYALGAADGVLRMIRTTPEGYKELGQVKAAEGQEFWGPMAISDGKLLVRVRRTLKCYDLSAAVNQK